MTRRLFAVRNFQLLLVFFAILISHSMRSSLSVAILAMTKEPSQSNSEDVPTYPEWNNVDTILSAYFWGYVMPGTGQVVKYFGPKRTLLVTAIVGAFTEILVPVVAANSGSTGVIASRVILGITQSFILPVIHSMLSNWIPLSQRATVANFVLGATAIATVTALPITGVICASGIGWPAVFYLYGSLLLAWSIIWFYCAADYPSQCPYISNEELLYLEGRIGDNSNSKRISIPWIAILTSLPFWAIVVAHVGSSWGGFTLLTQIPSYMKHILKFDIQSNGLLSALPYMVLWILTFFSGYSADKLITSHALRLGTVRKLYNSVGFLVCGLSLLTLGLIDNLEREVAIFLLTLAVGFFALTYSGFLLNPVDLSPNYSPVLSGISGCIANFASIIGPLSVQYLGNDKDDPVLWKSVFWIAAGFYFAAGLFYLVFASGEIQSWDNVGENEN